MRLTTALTVVVALALLLAAPASTKQRPADGTCPARVQAVQACDLTIAEIKALATTPPRFTYTAGPVTVFDAISDGPNRTGPPTVVQGSEGGVEYEYTEDVFNMTEAATCQFGVLSGMFGTFPWEQQVLDNTYRCWGNTTGLLKFRATKVTVTTSLCDTEDVYSFKYGGGAGHSHVLVEAGAYVACPTPVPWVKLHFHNCLHDFWPSLGTPRTIEDKCFG